jgi:25S rRNA (adenine2142-N1)-methyltransferase
MDWLKPLLPVLKGRKEAKLRMLEVGALSTGNACSRSGLFDIERIDLNSQGDGITKQDFMERPLSDDEKSQFDIISLSLVLNYVPDAAARGDMLKQTLKFLRPAPASDSSSTFPSLFLVLPVSCVSNSRYMDEARLEAIMLSLGYVKLHYKLSNKLAYFLWKATDLTPKKRFGTFKKTEVRAGGSRNNFAVVMK